MSPRFLFVLVLVTLAATVVSAGDKPDPRAQGDQMRADAMAKAQKLRQDLMAKFCAMTIDQKKVDEFVCMLKAITPANLKLHQDCFEQAGTKLPMNAEEKQVALCEKDPNKAETTSKAFTCVNDGAAGAGVDLDAEMTAYKKACK